MAKIIGCREQTGDFNGKPYHNYVLYIAQEKKDVSGYFTDCAKIKVVDAEEIFGVSPFDFKTLEAYMNVEVNVYFDKYQKVIKVEAVGGSEAKKKGA